MREARQRRRSCCYPIPVARIDSCSNFACEGIVRALTVVVGNEAHATSSSAETAMCRAPVVFIGQSCCCAAHRECARRIVDVWRRSMSIQRSNARCTSPAALKSQQRSNGERDKRPERSRCSGHRSGVAKGGGGSRYENKRGGVPSCDDNWSRPCKAKHMQDEVPVSQHKGPQGLFFIIHRR